MESRVQLDQGLPGAQDSSRGRLQSDIEGRIGAARGDGICRYKWVELRVWLPGRDRVGVVLRTGVSSLYVV